MCVSKRDHGNGGGDNIPIIVLCVRVWCVRAREIPQVPSIYIEELTHLNSVRISADRIVQGIFVRRYDDSKLSMNSAASKP